MAYVLLGIIALISMAAKPPLTKGICVCNDITNVDVITHHTLKAMLFG